MTSRNDLERAALAALEQWHSAGRAGQPTPRETAALTRAADELTFDCRECNLGGHTCPGCGMHVWHYGLRVCAQCDGPQRDPDHPNDPAPAQERCWCKRGTEDQLCPQHDPISGDLIPAGQDAELERMGREMAGEPTETERDLAELVLNVAQEWLRYASLGERDEQVRCTWHNDDEGETLHVESETGHGGRFKIHVRAQQLPDLPPIGPENDLGIYGIGETHDIPQWIERTAADVRRGDRIRMPGQDGTETDVLDRYWPPQPATRNPDGSDGLPADRGTWHVVPGERGHWDDHVVQPGECWLLLAGRDKSLNFPPTMPVEILLAPAEAAAIDALGWENRA